MATALADVELAAVDDDGSALDAVEDTDCVAWFCDAAPVEGAAPDPDAVLALGGTDMSCIWLMLFLPGRGSNAGMSALN